MHYHADDFQLEHLISLISKTHLVFGPKRNGHKTAYAPIAKASDVEWGYKRSILSFKKYLMPDGSPLTGDPKKIAFVGMPLCDIAALKIFLEQFKGSGLLPERNDLIIIGSDCVPDDNCFCDQFELEQNLDYDLFATRTEGRFLLQAKGWQGKELASKCGLMKVAHKIEAKPKSTSEKFDLALAKKNINNKTKTVDFWSKISNNCFGCGACSTVCPLCFCFRQDYQSCPSGEDKRCLHWDSCFSADFSQIQMGHDMRPENKDRLYNWYHHKFVRGPHELGNPLCVGCGRCITACPAHLSIHNILHAINKKYPQ